MVQVCLYLDISSATMCVLLKIESITVT